MRTFILICSICFTLAGCKLTGDKSSGFQTETGNPIYLDAGALSFSAYNVTSASFQAASVSEIRICLARLRLKVNDNDDQHENDSGDIDLRNIGYLTLNPVGTNLPGLEVPSGTYQRIEFEIEANCDGNGSPAVSVDNDNDGGNPFTMTENVRMRFDGSFVINESTNVELTIGNLVNNLDAVTDADDIADVFADVSSDGEIRDDD